MDKDERKKQEKKSGLNDYVCIYGRRQLQLHMCLKYAGFVNLAPQYL